MALVGGDIRFGGLPFLTAPSVSDNLQVTQ